MDNTSLGNILILGGSSKLASLLRANWKTTAFDNAIWQFRKPVNYRRVALGHELLVFDPLAYGSAAIGLLQGVQTVLCFAGETGGSVSDLSINKVIAEASLKLAEDIGAKRLFYISSAAVYGDGQMLTEFDEPNPCNDYGESKLQAEALLSGSDSAVSVTILRLGNVLFGDSITCQLRPGSGLNSVNLDFFPNGKSLTRSYIDSVSLLKVIEKLARNDTHYRLLNVASVESVEVESLLTKLGVQITRKDRTYWSSQNITMSTNLLRQFVGADELAECWRRSQVKWSESASSSDIFSWNDEV